MEQRLIKQSVKQLENELLEDKRRKIEVKTFDFSIVRADLMGPFNSFFLIA